MQHHISTCFDFVAIVGTTLLSNHKIDHYLTKGPEPVFIKEVDVLVGKSDGVEEIIDMCKKVR